MPQIWKNLPHVGVNSLLKALIMIEGEGFKCMKSYRTRIQKNLPQVGVNSVLKALIERTGFGNMKSYYTQTLNKRF